MKKQNELLSHFREFPEIFFDWLCDLMTAFPANYTLEEAKNIYRINSVKEVGFIYRKYLPKSASWDNAWYDENNFLTQINVELSSIGKPITFFGSIKEYKNLLNELMLGSSGTCPKFKEFYQFGKIYLFSTDSIKNPMEVF